MPGKATKLQQAFTSFTYCVDRARRTPECYYNRAIVSESLSKIAGELAPAHLDSALKDYAKALEIDPNLGIAHLNRGILFLARKQYSEAEADLTAALAKNAPPAVVHYNLAVLKNSQKRRPEALAHLRLALKADPKHPESLALLADLSK